MGCHWNLERSTLSHEELERRVEELVLLGVEPNLIHPGAGWTLIHQVALNGRIDLIQILKKVGAQMNVPDFGGYTQLHFAASGGHARACQVLLELHERSKQ